MDCQDYEHIFHEIKNMICLIGSSLQLIEKQHPEVSSFDYWPDTRSDLNMLRQLLLNLSTASHYNNISLKTTEVSDFLQDLETNTRFILGDAISYRFETETGLLPISMDALALKQAFINLIKNAKEAMGTSGLLTIHTYQKEQFLVFEITDNGPGMDQSMLAKLYTPHVTSKVDGSGLGLFITASIIHAHNGNLNCKSALGQGTTFIIQLPYENGHD